MLAIFLIAFAVGKPVNVGIQAVESFYADGLKAGLRQMLAFGPAMLLAFS